jgi:hypothetical protein
MKVRFGARSRESLSSLKISRTFMQTGKTCAAQLIKLKRFQSPASPDCPLNFAEIHSGPGGHCYCHLFSLLLRRNGDCRIFTQPAPSINCGFQKHGGLSLHDLRNCVS